MRITQIPGDTGFDDTYKNSIPTLFVDYTVVHVLRRYTTYIINLLYKKIFSAHLISYDKKKKPLASCSYIAFETIVCPNRIYNAHHRG